MNKACKNICSPIAVSSLEERIFFFSLSLPLLTFTKPLTRIVLVVREKLYFLIHREIVCTLYNFIYKNTV